MHPRWLFGISSINSMIVYNNKFISTIKLDATRFIVINYMTFIWMICFIIQLIQFVTFRKNANRGHNNTPKRLLIQNPPSLGHSEEPGYHFMICLRCLHWSFISISTVQRQISEASTVAFYLAFNIYHLVKEDTHLRCFVMDLNVSPFLSESILPKKTLGATKCDFLLDYHKLPVKNCVDAPWLEFAQHSFFSCSTSTDYF